MDKLKILNTLNNLIEDHWEVDIQELFEASLTEPDKKKQEIYDALYTYILQRRQNDIIKRNKFKI